jgi:hypothetical protein
MEYIVELFQDKQEPLTTEEVFEFLQRKGLTNPGVYGLTLRMKQIFYTGKLEWLNCQVKNGNLRRKLIATNRYLYFPSSSITLVPALECNTAMKGEQLSLFRAGFSSYMFI